MYLRDKNNYNINLIIHSYYIYFKVLTRKTFVLIFEPSESIILDKKGILLAVKLLKDKRIKI